ncbi:type IX secretion system plug protein [Bizionia sp. KMM 8389]
MFLRSFLPLAILLFSLTASAQIEQEVNPPGYIKSITFQSQTAESQLPIMQLGSQLVLEFDALNGDEDDFYYKIEHYNYDWTPSQLIKTEFLSGIDNQRIRDYENSFNTYQIYSHYTLTLPNSQTRGLKVSGNYMIKVYDNYDELVFSRKFMIQENLANVGVEIKRARDVKQVESMQSVDIKINSGNILFNNPSQTVKTLIVQNNNLNTAISNVPPQYTIGNELIYKYTNETLFEGGNEYFYFENKDIRGANAAIQYIELHELYSNYLFTNVPRANQPYTYNPDINGNFLITAIDAEKPDIEADYAWMHFSLLLKQLPANKSVHVYGNFNNYAIDASTKMTFNASKNIYEVPIILKQGFYNYKYVIVDNNSGALDENTISGSYWQTENNYKVIVYYRDLGGRYDRIVGVGEGNSVNITN